MDRMGSSSQCRNNAYASVKQWVCQQRLQISCELAKLSDIIQLDGKGIWDTMTQGTVRAAASRKYRDVDADASGMM